jgi:nitrogen fixation/metabolism regulation signal transduction histidine kinase
MSLTAYLFIGLTAIVACLVAVLAFAVLRLAAAARDTRAHSRTSGTEMALMSAALHEAVSNLKAQERATAARAEASERLNDEIISSLTAGLLVAGLDGDVRTLNPAGRRMLGLSDTADAA